MNEQGLESLSKVGFFLELIHKTNKITHASYEIVTEPKKVKASLNLRNIPVQSKPQRFRYSLGRSDIEKLIRIAKNLKLQVERLELLVPEGTLRLRTNNIISGSGLNIFGLNIDIFRSNKTEFEKIIISNRDFKIYSNNISNSFIGKENANIFTIYSSNYLPEGKPIQFQRDHISRQVNL